MLTPWACIRLLLVIVIIFDPEKKLSHSSGKSSKNKKSKQKGKGKADSAEKESWRQETVSKPEQSAVAELPATEAPSDHFSETESTSLVQSTEPKQVINTVTNHEEEIGKPQDAKIENKVAAIERDERNECDNEMESKTKVTSENEANDADTYRASEKEKSDVIFRQEPVVPLRSRGDYFYRHVYESSPNVQNVLVCLYKSWKFKLSIKIVLDWRLMNDPFVLVKASTLRKPRKWSMYSG